MRLVLVCPEFPLGNPALCRRFAQATHQNFQFYQNRFMVHRSEAKRVLLLNMALEDVLQP